MRRGSEIIGTAGLTAVAMVAFAANSILTRAGLQTGATDPGAFSSVRLAAGAVGLSTLVAIRRTRVQPSASIRKRTWVSASALTVYAVGFSYAYVSLGAGTGALILFGVVQATILATAMARGERPEMRVWLGLIVSLIGLLLLVGPGATAPNPRGAVLMTLAGVAWAVYTLRGRHATEPLVVTMWSFVLALPLAALVVLASAVTSSLRMSASGFALAVLSGAIASGMGYAIWYAALPKLSRTTAGIVQLTPAPLAALGSLWLLGEPITGRYIGAATLILGGVALALSRPRRSNTPTRR